jgi:NAD(P)-dependent dehydrogenase (short-subunit alcohol dehydrogenase family)
LDELAARHPGNVLTFVHDVHDYGAVPELFQDVTGQLGGLDLFIYAAGVMPDIAPREYSFEKDREILEVNLVGAMAWLDQAAHRFDQVGHGSLVAIGSRAGERGIGKMPAYCASKAAIATYMESLRNRLARRGVKVVTVKPGPIDTPMIANLHLNRAMPVQTAARIVLRKSRSTGEHFLKASDRVMCWVVKRIPSALFRRMKS